MIRVGFLLGQVGWLGGVNYFRNLLSAIASEKNICIQPVIFTSLTSDNTPFEGLAEVVPDSMFERRSPRWFIRNVAARMPGLFDPILKNLLKKNRIDIVFHFGTEWRCNSVASIGWIPDFQHIYYPEFFSQSEWDARDAQFTNITDKCTSLVFSSFDALCDMKKRYPGNQKPTHVLQFVSSLMLDASSMCSVEELKRKYSLSDEWLHLPNQFWMHKNHRVVLDAMNLLNKRGSCPVVVSTGKTTDYRNPGYFPEIIKVIEEYKLNDKFLPLGVVPYRDVVSIMYHSRAVINPSLFEGWSTSVEESKTMGKPIVLSDIPVHLEQNPEFGFYFDSKSPESLASQLEAVWDLRSSGGACASGLSIPSKNFEIRRSEFALNFERICIDTFEAFKNPTDLV